MADKHKFVIGIDLGTTNCALAYVELNDDKDSKPDIKDFLIPQLTGPGVVEEKPLLPSFMYIASNVEFAEGALDLPWAKGRGYFLGEFAQKRGSESPKRLVSSAKSWLCHEGVSRNDKILPFGPDIECEKFSPIEVTAKYLEHLKDAWNYKMASKNKENRMEEQSILITVPASFDAAARDLTLKAAESAGLSNITLLEEPQAAFYSWLNQMGDGWRREVKEGDVVLVFDVGGGTTDFSLIAVTQKGGDLTLNRIAVGNHILLGGDNMDIALANLVRNKIEAAGKKIDNWQFQALWYSSRNAKEIILSDPKMDKVPVTVLSRGKSVIGGVIKSEITRGEIEEMLLNGFFPAVKSNDMPSKTIRSGLSEIGLPYATEPAITKHLAKFLSEHINNENYNLKGKGKFVHPTAVLFNGGVMKSDILRLRSIETLNDWLAADAGSSLKNLSAVDMALAVARGAAYFGNARLGRGIRIKGGTARSYYIGIQTAMPAIPGLKAPMKALCVVPARTEEGTTLEIPGREFELCVGEESEFKMFSSATHKEEAPGKILDEWAEGDLIEMPSLKTTIEVREEKTGTVIPVTLESAVTEIGTVEVWCVARNNKKYKLEFNIRESN
ncbi:MAG: Hsp70 family protein [Candidatus Wallbacteria bacterium]